MTDDDDNNTQAGLDALLQDARANPPQVPDALMARVLADAALVQPIAARAGWRVWLGNIGGLPGVGGLITASCVGFWLGVAPPAGLPDLAGNVLGVQAAFDAQIEGDLEGGALTAFGWDIEEG